MNISKNCVVRYHYILKNTEGTLLQSSYDDEALIYMHGHNQIVPGLEKAMEGKKCGDRFSITITPEEGFGQRQENLTERIPLKYLKGSKNWKPGMAAFVKTRQGYQQVQIIKLGRFMVDVDLNHPLAGQTLHYEVEIVDLREASNEELARGMPYKT